MNQKAAGQGLGHPLPAVGPVSGKTHDLPQLSLRLGDPQSGPGTLQQAPGTLCPFQGLPLLLAPGVSASQPPSLVFLNPL